MRRRQFTTFLARRRGCSQRAQQSERMRRTGALIPNAEDDPMESGETENAAKGEG
jgi:hypothetical protein